MKDHISIVSLNTKSDDHLVHVNIEPRIKLFHGLIHPTTNDIHQLSKGRFNTYTTYLKQSIHFGIYAFKSLSKHTILNLQCIDHETAKLLFRKLSLRGHAGKKGLIEAINIEPALVEQILLLEHFRHLYGIITPIGGQTLIVVNRCVRLKNELKESSNFTILDSDNRKLSFNCDSVERVDINDLLLMA